MKKIIGNIICVGITLAGMYLIMYIMGAIITFMSTSWIKVVIGWTAVILISLKFANSNWKE